LPGNYLAGMFSRNLKIWEQENLCREMNLIGSFRLDVFSIAVSLYGYFYILVGTGDHILIYNFLNFLEVETNNDVLRSLKGHNDDITSIIILGDKRIVSSSRDSSIRLWK
jgi:WD40 repeat protein